MDFVTHGGVEDYHNEITGDGNTVYYLSTMRKSGVLKYYKNLKSIIASGNYDVIHFHSAGPRLMILPYIKKRTKSKIVIHSHSTAKGRWPAFFWKWVSLRYADELLACGKEAGITAYGEKADFTVIPNAIDINRFSAEKNLNPDLRKHIFGDAIAVIHIGAFIELKNHKFIIDMAQKIKEQNAQIKIALVGTGPLYEDIKECIINGGLQDHVVLLGKRTDVNRLLVNCDCFILPSLYEGLPVSGIEAQFSGCKCIFSDSISSETDQHFGNSVFLPLSDIEPWIREIKSSKNKLPLNMNELRCSCYNINNSVNVLESIYEK